MIPPSTSQIAQKIADKLLTVGYNTTTQSGERLAVMKTLQGGEEVNLGGRCHSAIAAEISAVLLRSGYDDMRLIAQSLGNAVRMCHILDKEERLVGAPAIPVAMERQVRRRTP